METLKTTEEVSSHGVEKRVKRRTSHRNTPCAGENRRQTGKKLENILANRWSSKKIMKKPHAGRGHKTIWEIPIKK